MGKLSTLMLLGSGLLKAKQFAVSQTAKQAIATAEAIEEMGALLYLVEGTQERETNVWTGILGGISELLDGMTIDYRLPYAGTAEPATLTLTLSDGNVTDAVPVYRDAANPVTSQFSAGTILRLTYLESQNRWQHSAISDVALSVRYDAERKALSLVK